MIKKSQCLVAAVFTAFLFVLAGCGPAAEKSTESTETKRDEYINGSYVQYPDIRDYTCSWWENGISRTADNRFCVQTGHYGLTLNGYSGMISAIGAIEEEYTQTQACRQDMNVIDSLPAIKTGFSIVHEGRSNPFSYNVETVGVSKAVSRIIESGRYIQGFDVPGMKFSGMTDVFGKMEVKASPEYLGLGFSVYSAYRELKDAQLVMTLTFPEGYGVIEQGQGYIVIADGSGNGLSVVQDQGESLSFDSGSRVLSICSLKLDLPVKEYNGFGAIIIPSVNASSADAEAYRAISGVLASAVQISPKEGREQKVEFDARRGMLVIDISKMNTYRGQQFGTEKAKTAMDRLSFTISNPADKVVKVPVMFEKTGNFGVEGFAPLLRDVSSGEPIGVPVQLSKNWHEYGDWINDPYGWWKDQEGVWFHGFTYLEIPAGESINYELDIAYNSWGGVNTASHSQICLVGWYNSSTQIWDTSAIGSCGESFCYDPDTNCGYGFINDVRTVGYDPYQRGDEYVWGANCGGGNFLYYGRDGQNLYGTTDEIIGYKMVRVDYKTQGPNLAEVIYTGRTADDAVEFKLTAYLGRTNDVSKAIHSFEYRFLKDVAAERLAFYQFGADNHNSGYWNELTIGNSEGPIDFKLNGQKYSAAFIPPTGDTPGYVGDNGMQRIEVPGDGMWVAFSDGQTEVSSKEPQGMARIGNRMLNLLEFDAEINGVRYTKPAFNLRRTVMNVGGKNQSMLVELCAPAEAGNVIKAGSIVTGSVQYLVLPNSLEDYYYESEVLRAVPPDDFNTWRLAYRYALGEKTEATAAVGTILRQYPLKVECAGDERVIAEISIKGGISYQPITFSSVPSYAGYRLERKTQAGWEALDQGLYGNDYWQAWYDAEKGTYELTFNVEHDGKDAEYEYRLVKS